VIDRKREALRHDADHGGLRSSELHRLPNHVRASCEPSLPHRVAEHDDRWCAGLFVALEERPAQERRYAHKAKRRRRNLGDGHRLRTRAVTHQVPLQRAIRTQFFDRADVAPPADEVVQHTAFILNVHRVAHLDLDDAVAVGQRQRRPHEISVEVVPRRADADGDRQREPAGDREARKAAKHPEPEFEVQP
jgi:hypothetical protein